MVTSRKIISEAWCFNRVSHEMHYALVFTCYYIFWAKKWSPGFWLFFNHVIYSRDLMSQTRNHQSSESPWKYMYKQYPLRKRYLFQTATPPQTRFFPQIMHTRVTVRLWSCRQRNEYHIDVNNSGSSFARKAFKEKKDRTSASRKWQSHGVKINQELE